jgi:hypothetical protein
MNALLERPKPWAVAAVMLAAALLATSACNNVSTPDSQEPDHPPANLFLDLTASSGIEHTYKNGQEAKHFAIIESLGPGMALIDYDRDGLLDVFVTGGGYFDRTDEELQKEPSKLPGLHGHPWKLYKNLGNFHFKDVTKEVGLDKLAGNKEFFYSHGAAVCDYDRDGYPDLLVTGWHRMALFHNVPVDPKDPTKGRRFVDVSKEVGLPEGLWTTSAAWADLDGDGWPDLYVCQYVDWGFTPDLKHPRHCRYDGKTNDVCPPKQFTALPHHVFHNVPDAGRPGGRKFVDVSKEAGLRMPRSDDDYKALEQTIRKFAYSDPQYAKLSKDDRDTEVAGRVARWIERLRKAEKNDKGEKVEEYGKGLGVLAVDLNGDGKPDIYVANDTVDKLLYMNRSKPGQILLEELGMPTGTARDDRGSPNGSMGLAAFDYDRCGRPSLWVTNYENELHALYHNECKEGKEFFVFATQMSGIAAIGQNYVGWGTGTFDLFHDGWESIFVTNGHAIRFPPGKAARKQRPMLLQNLGMLLPAIRARQEQQRSGNPEAWTVRFKDITDQGGSYFQNVHEGRGAVLGDLDNDGRIDIILINLNEPVAVLKNDANTGGNHWLGVELIGKDHADVVGAKIALEVDGATQYRFAQSGGSYESSSDRRHVFGLGKATKYGRLTVTWPSGEKQGWDGLAIDRYWRLIQGQKEAQAPLKPR